MKKRKVSIVILIIASIFAVVYFSSVKKAVFINVKPTIKMGDIEYMVTSDVISKSKLGKQVGRVTQILALVSYPEKDNPYKKPSKIYKIKGKNIEDEVALKMNNKFYIAKFIDNISNK